jgi:hypothetical protein
MNFYTYAYTNPEGVWFLAYTYACNFKQLWKRKYIRYVFINSILVTHVTDVFMVGFDIYEMNNGYSSIMNLEP